MLSSLFFIYQPHKNVFIRISNSWIYAIGSTKYSQDLLNQIKNYMIQFPLRMNYHEYPLEYALYKIDPLVYIHISNVTTIS